EQLLFMTIIHFNLAYLSRAIPIIVTIRQFPFEHLLRALPVNDASKQSIINNDNDKPKLPVISLSVAYFYALNILNVQSFLQLRIDNHAWKDFFGTIIHKFQKLSHHLYPLQLFGLIVLHDEAKFHQYVDWHFQMVLHAMEYHILHQVVLSVAMNSQKIVMYFVIHKTNKHYLG